MEEKQKFPTATGFSGKILIASLFILSGILLFARNMGWITSEVFDMIVSWHSLLIILGIYSMIRRHFIGGIILLLIGLYFLIGGDGIDPLFMGISRMGCLSVNPYGKTDKAFSSCL